VHLGPIDTIFTAAGVLMAAGGLYAAPALRPSAAATATPGKGVEKEGIGTAAR
jgi:hypothetical protein